MSIPDFSAEHRAIADGHVVCGIDEAGRGPWAGPVVAAAVILDSFNIPAGLNDSKRLSEARREALFEPILRSAHVGIGMATASEIDSINILNATHQAMVRAVQNLMAAPTIALVDGNRAPSLSCSVVTIIGGDGLSLSIASASIIAKVTRDRLMHDMHALYPDYGFSAHKGYGTAQHQFALQKFGPCPEHRKSFSPIKGLLRN